LDSNPAWFISQTNYPIGNCTCALVQPTACRMHRCICQIGTLVYCHCAIEELYEDRFGPQTQNGYLEFYAVGIVHCETPVDGWKK